MKRKKENLDPVLEGPGATMRLINWGGMSVVYNSYSERTDFTPLLKGLKDDMCQCPHWGYVLKGAFHISYTDGREEVYEAGDLWYAPPGHTGCAEEGTEVVELSPEAAFAELLKHIKSQAGA